MTRSTRRVLFYIAIVLFFAVSYVVLLYAQGYKYSFSDEKFVRTGAIALKTNVSATVLLNGVAAKDTSFLTNNAGIDTLLPGTYTVAVQTKGYSVWQKKVTVQQGYVQDFGHVMLLPQTDGDRDNARAEIQQLLYPPTPQPTPTATPSGTKKPKPMTTPKPSVKPSPTPDLTAPYYILGGSLYVQTPKGPASIASNITQVFQSSDDQKIAWFSGTQLWVYWLNDTDYQPYHRAGDMVLLANFMNPVKALAWFRDSDHLALDNGNLHVIEIDNRGGTNIINF